MCGATSRLRKTTTDFRIGAGAHLNDGVVQKSAFARFLASFDFRLFQHHRSKTEVTASKRDFRSAPNNGHRSDSPDWSGLRHKRHRILFRWWDLGDQPLLMQEQIDTLVLKALQDAQQIRKRSARDGVDPGPAAGK